MLGRSATYDAATLALLSSAPHGWRPTGSASMMKGDLCYAHVNRFDSGHAGCRSRLSDPGSMLLGMSRKPRREHGRTWTPGRAGDTVDGMARGQVELEPEVAQWLESLDDQRWAQALFHLDLLEERGALLGEPYTRQLIGKLRELRFYCGGERIRITYWIAPGRRIIALTVFAKTRMRESAEISRASRAMARCQQEGHTPDEDEEEGPG
jgi:hypothetical protein